MLVWAHTVLLPGELLDTHCPDVAVTLPPLILYSPQGSTCITCSTPPSKSKIQMVKQTLITTWMIKQGNTKIKRKINNKIPPPSAGLLLPRLPPPRTTRPPCPPPNITPSFQLRLGHTYQLRSDQARFRTPSQMCRCENHGGGAA